MKYYNISYEEAQNRVQQNEASFNINMFDEFVEEEPEMPEIKFPFQQGQTVNQTFFWTNNIIFSMYKHKINSFG